MKPLLFFHKSNSPPYQFPGYVDPMDLPLPIFRAELLLLFSTSVIAACLWGHVADAASPYSRAQFAGGFAVEHSLLPRAIAVFWCPPSYPFSLALTRSNTIVMRKEPPILLKLVFDTVGCAVWASYARQSLVRRSMSFGPLMRGSMSA